MWLIFSCILHGIGNQDKHLTCMQGRRSISKEKANDQNNIKSKQTNKKKSYTKEAMNLTIKS